MKSNDDLLQSLAEYAEWAEANIYEVPIMLPDILVAAAETIRRLEEELAQRDH